MCALCWCIGEGAGETLVALEGLHSPGVEHGVNVTSQKLVRVWLPLHPLCWGRGGSQACQCGAGFMGTRRKDMD